MDYKIKTTEIVKTILLVETNPTLLGPYSEVRMLVNYNMYVL